MALLQLVVFVTDDGKMDGQAPRLVSARVVQFAFPLSLYSVPLFLSDTEVLEGHGVEKGWGVIGPLVSEGHTSL